MKTTPAYPSRLSVARWRPQLALTLLLAVIISACGGGGGGGGGGGTTPPPTSAPNSGAVYVFTGDAAAAITQQAYIKASNTDGEDRFGWSVIGLSGDTLAVGAHHEAGATTGVNGDQSNNSSPTAGAAYVFTRDAAGVWSQQAYIKASNTDGGDRFGIAVALSGDTLAVSTRFEGSAATGVDGDQSDNSAAGAGAVYVFTRDAAGAWSQQAYIKASNTDANDWFGHSIALSGDTLAVGAVMEDSAATGIDGDQSDDGAADAGAVYVFTRDAGGVWSQQAYIKASNTDAGDEFGDAIALSGDTLAVGAVFEDSAATGIDGDQNDNNAPNSGAVYVFTRDAAGVWSQQAYIKTSNTDAGDWFAEVALSGDTLAVGAKLEASAATGIDGDQSNDSANDAGAVYVYTRDAAGAWSQQAFVKASNTDADDWFGVRVALSGDKLAVGANFEDSAATGIDGDQSNSSAASAGAVYVFTRDAAGAWSQQNYVKASNAGTGDEFGLGVALSGNTLAVGAFLEDSAATGIAGSQNDDTAITSVAVHAFGSDPNAINPGSNDVISMAVLGSANFDATQVDFSTAELGPGRAPPVHDGHVEDINGDGFFDKVFHFHAQDTGIACGDTDATLSGKTFSGDPFTGTDSVETAGCH